MAPVWSGIPSESEPLHAQHTPATPHPQERRNGLSTGLQRPKQVSIAGGARTCYSSPRAIVHSNSTSTYYTYRTCIYSKVHTCYVLYYSYSACMRYGYITCTHYHCTDPEVVKPREMEPKSGMSQTKGGSKKTAWKRSKHPPRSLPGAPDLPRASFGASARSRMWTFG